MSRADPALARLDAALDAVAAALAAGAFARLGPLATEMTEALAAVEARGPMSDRDALVRLAARARRNAAGLAAATRGVRAARQRLRDLSEAEQGIGTYDRSGQRSVIGAGSGRVLHRS